MIDKTLLQKAYPEKLVPVVGVRSVSGFFCVRVGRYQISPGSPLVTASTWIRFQSVYREIDVVHVDAEDKSKWEVSSGGLLPNVDPKDRATWVCLLEEFGNFLGMDSENGYSWNKYNGDWILMCGQGHPKHENISERMVFKGINTDDPAEALVLARAGVHEERENEA